MLSLWTASSQSFSTLIPLSLGEQGHEGQGCPGHSRMFSSIPGFYLLDTSSRSQCDKQKHLQEFPLWGSG